MRVHVHEPPMTVISLGTMWWVWLHSLCYVMRVCVCGVKVCNAAMAVDCMPSGDVVSFGMFPGLVQWRSLNVSPPPPSPPPPPPPPPPPLQPENLLLASKEKGASVKLADFGLAVEAMDGKHYYGESLPPSLPLSLPPFPSLSACVVTLVTK